ncbi:glycosyltransferase family 1 protein [Methanophagales archaeon]|nr:MAG: glycosyltransferase family 1 protein [Methanophagales archaeon]
MNILYVWPYWYYSQVALEFLQMIAKRGHRIDVLLGECKYFSTNAVLTDSINIHFVSKWDFISKIIGTPYPIFRNITSLIRRIDPDIIHVNSHLFLSNYQVIRVAKSIGIPSVMTVHGIMAERGLIMNIMQSFYLRTLSKKIFKEVSAIICLTKSDAKVIAKIVGNNNRMKINIIPNGIDIERFKPSLIKDPNLIVWTGRLVPEKGLIYALKAMRKIIEEHNNVKLVLVGEGPLKNTLMRLTNKLGLAKRVVFTGMLDRMKIAKLLSKTSIFIFPSLREGLPLSILEAMSSGAVQASFRRYGLGRCGG